MQPVTEEQKRILLAPAITVTSGLELLNADRAVVEDLTDVLVGGEVDRAMGRTPHGACTLDLERELRWGIDLVRPYMTVSDGSAEARWNLGVFALTTPETIVGETPQVYRVQGYDRLHLLDRQVGMDYSVAAGTTYRDALRQVFADAGLTGALIAGSAADSVLPVTRLWPLVAETTDPDETNTPVTWLRIVNDLLRAINFRGVYADENGTYRCEPYVSPKDRAVEFTFDTDPKVSIVGEKREFIRDVWAIPNRWVFRQTNRPDGAPAATEGDGVYTYVLPPSHDLSAENRGLVWTSVVDYEAATQAALVALGDRRVAADLRATAKITVDTGPFPPAGHDDVFTYTDNEAGGSRKVVARAWSLPLDGSDMRWTWEDVG